MITIIAGMSCAGKDTIQNYLLQKDYSVMILSSKKTHRLACGYVNVIVNDGDLKSLYKQVDEKILRI